MQQNDIILASEAELVRALVMTGHRDVKPLPWSRKLRGPQDIPCEWVWFNRDGTSPELR
jgi:hypothetical protein